MNDFADEQAGKKPISSSELFPAPTSDALQLLQSWIRQPGLPLLKLSADDVSPAVLTQSRYYDWGQGAAGDPFANANASTWYVPLAVGRLGSPNTAGAAEKAWTETLNNSQVVANLGNSLAEGLMLNARGSGYYR